VIGIGDNNNGDLCFLPDHPFAAGFRNF